MGLNINKTDYDYRDLFNSGAENKNADRNFEAIILPNLQLTYQVGENHKIYGNISRGFSNPTVEETLTPDGVINPDITQETGINYELGTQLLLDKNRLRIDLSIYQMNIRNLLVGERIEEDRFVGKNAGETRHRGVEVSLNYTWKKNQHSVCQTFIFYNTPGRLDYHFIPNNCFI